PGMLAMLQQSTLGAGLLAARGTFLSGLHTYLMKLGPGNLWHGASEIDRRIAASFPALTNRIRLQDVARLIADGVAQSPADSRPWLFVDIAGGPAADAWNALLTIRAERPELLAHRRITIAVFDPDSDGPAFGAAALARLTSTAGPLHGP